ncbi:MAG TPA: methyl-accepting chemotaxis protein [Solirubrobacteraceae bacterium]|nr:methyl-accepting chemotaxis protein [Solirubrobacteraceae bacterium]
MAYTQGIERPRPGVADGQARHGGVPLIFWVLGFVLAAYSISLIVRPNGETWTWLDGWGTALFELAGGLLVLLRGWVVPAERRIAWWLGAGMCAWAAGDFAMTAETLGGANAPVLGPAQILWACFYPPAYVGLMLLIRREVRKFSLANWLDGLVAGLGAAAVFAAFAFSGIAQAAGGGTLSVATNLVFPVGDLLLLILVMGGIAILPAGQRTRWYLIGAAIAINATGDIFALFPNGIGASHTGFFFNTVAWPASMYLVAAAIWLRGQHRDQPVELAERPAGFLVPGIAASASLVVLCAGAFSHSDRVGAALAMATLLVAAVRIGISLLHLRSLTDERHAELARAADVERASREALELAVDAYSRFAAKVAEGDLTVVVESDAAAQELRGLSDSLNRMVGGLADISTEVHAGVRDIRLSTTEILDAVNQYSGSAAQQSDAIQETSTTVNEVRMAADQTARKASDVAARAQESVSVGDDGMRAVRAIAEAMSEIRSRVDGIAADVLTLSERTAQIGEITKTVNDLADRSNLLALNASVEAARAGEHGRGFAVVATEVRDLAEQSKAATAEVERVLSEIQYATSAAVLATEQGTKVVERGLSLTEQAGSGIESLTETIRSAAYAAQEIATSAHQQSVGMDQIASAMGNVSEVTTSQFLAGAERSQRAAENLNGLSEKLAALTERYRVDDQRRARAA